MISCVCAVREKDAEGEKVQWILHSVPEIPWSFRASQLEHAVLCCAALLGLGARVRGNVWLVGINLNLVLNLARVHGHELSADKACGGARMYQRSAAHLCTDLIYIGGLRRRSFVCHCLDEPSQLEVV